LFQRIINLALHIFIGNVQNEIVKEIDLIIIRKLWKKNYYEIIMINYVSCRKQKYINYVSFKKHMINKEAIRRVISEFMTMEFPESIKREMNIVYYNYY